MALTSYPVLNSLPPLIIITSRDCSHALSTENACRSYPVESVPKMELILPVSYLQYIWLYVAQIESIHLSHLCNIFPLLCVLGGCTIIFCHMSYLKASLNFWSTYQLIAVESVFMIKSQLSFNQCMGPYVFVLPYYLMMIVRMCTSSYFHHEIRNINHIPLFRVRS